MKGKTILILWVFSMCMLVCLCTTEAKLGKKNNLQGLENGQAGQGKVSTACLVVGKISEILRFRRPTSLLYVSVVFCMLYLMEQNRKSAQCNRNPNPAISNSPATNSSCRRLPDMDQNGTNQTLLLFLLS